MENDLKRYGRILWHWAWLIVLGTVLAASVAYITSHLTIPVYSASTTLLVSQAPNNGQSTDYASILTSQQLAHTYSDLLTKRPVLERAIANLKIDILPASLTNWVAVNVVKDTQLIVLKVENEDPALAADLANEIPVVFSRQNADIQAARYADSKASLQKEIDSLRQQIDQKQSQVDAIGVPANVASQANLSRLQSDMTQLRQSLAQLLQSYQGIRLAEIQSTNNIVVVEPALVPAEPVRPRTFQNTLLGGIIGLMLAVGSVFLIEYLDDRVRSPEQIEQLLKLPVIGLIAKMNLKSRSEVNSSSLIALDQPRSPIVEAFRSLRTNIQYASIDQPIRTLLLTSARPAEGKSTIAVNLAIVMAQTGLKVYLVDGDLRRPTVHKFFEKSDRGGLTDLILQDPAKWNGVGESSLVENLMTIFSGPLPPNPSELLGSKRMQQFIGYLHQSSDLVIIDAPPLLPVTDSLVMAQFADGVIMVANAGSTRTGEVVQGKAQLDQVGARVIGVVLNMIPTGRGRYSYYHYSYQHYYDSEHADGQRSKSRSKDRQTAADSS